MAVSLESIDRQIKALRKVTEAFSELQLSQIEGLLVAAALVTGIYQIWMHGLEKNPEQIEKIISSLFSIENIKSRSETIN